MVEKISPHPCQNRLPTRVDIFVARQPLFDHVIHQFPNTSLRRFAQCMQGLIRCFRDLAFK